MIIMFAVQFPLCPLKKSPGQEMAKGISSLSQSKGCLFRSLQTQSCCRGRLSAASWTHRVMANTQRLSTKR